MKVLVTGGKGFIGSWVVKDLIDQGQSPVIYDLAHKPFLFPDIEKSIEVIEGDITDLETTISALRHSNAEIIIHTAALTNVEKAQFQPAETVRINIGGTLHLLEAARILRIRRFVYTSSRGIFGHIEDDHGHPTYQPVKEDYRSKPHTIYGSTKFFCECLGLNYARTHGLEFCGLRFSMIYGPGKGTTHGSGAFHSVLIEETLEGHPVTIPRGANQKDDLIYVRDVARATVLAALTPRVSSSLYNIGTGVASTPIDFACAVKALLPQAQIQIGPGLDYLSRGYQNYCIFDISRARSELGFEPRYNLTEGIQDYINTLKRVNGSEDRRGKRNEAEG